MEQPDFFTCLRKVRLQKLGYNRDFQQHKQLQKKSRMQKIEFYVKLINQDLPFLPEYFIYLLNLATWCLHLNLNLTFLSFLKSSYFNLLLRVFCHICISHENSAEREDATESPFLHQVLISLLVYTLRNCLLLFVSKYWQLGVVKQKKGPFSVFSNVSWF